MKNKFYIRLLTYNEANRVIKKMESFGGSGYMMDGAVSLLGDDIQIHSIVEYMTNNCRRFELSKTHPTITVNEIIDDLKKRELI